MIHVAIDTAIDGCSVAILNKDKVLGEQHIPQSALIFPLMDNLLKAHGLVYQDLGAVAVTRGPGSFTGLRLGLAAAQGWCLAGRLPLWGLKTLDCLAYQTAEHTRPLLVAISTKRDDFYVSRYTPGNFFGTDPHIMTAEELLQNAGTYRVVVWTEPEHPLRQELSMEQVQLKAASVGQLAWYAQAHNPDVFAQEPFYLRPAKVYEGNHAVHH